MKAHILNGVFMIWQTDSDTSMSYYYFFNVAGHACSIISERSEFKVKLLKENIQHT